MKSTLILCSIVSLGLFSGCGKGLSKLTPDQKAVLKESISEAEDAFSAPTEARRNGNRLVLSAIYGSESERRKVHMTERLHQSLTNGDCQDATESSLERPSLGKPASPGFNIPKIRISGPNCPISMEIKLAGTDKKITINLKYKVQNPEYKQLTDITEANLDFSSSFESQKSLSSEFSGKVLSQKSGVIEISGNSKMSESGQFQSQIRFDYPSFAAELKAEGSENGSIQYYLNGELLSEPESREYVKGGFLPVGGKKPTFQSF